MMTDPHVDLFPALLAGMPTEFHNDIPQTMFFRLQTIILLRIRSHLVSILKIGKAAMIMKQLHPLCFNKKFSKAGLSPVQAQSQMRKQNFIRK